MASSLLRVCALSMVLACGQESDEAAALGSLKEELGSVASQLSNLQNSAGFEDEAGQDDEAGFDDASGASDSDDYDDEGFDDDEDEDEDAADYEDDDDAADYESLIGASSRSRAKDDEENEGMLGLEGSMLFESSGHAEHPHQGLRDLISAHDIDADGKLSAQELRPIFKDILRAQAGSKVKTSLTEETEEDMDTVEDTDWSEHGDKSEGKSDHALLVKALADLDTLAARDEKLAAQGDKARMKAKSKAKASFVQTEKSEVETSEDEAQTSSEHRNDQTKEKSDISKLANELAELDAEDEHQDKVLLGDDDDDMYQMVDALDRDGDGSLSFLELQALVPAIETGA